MSFLITGCGSTSNFIEHPYEKGSGDKYAAVNEGASYPMGVGIIRHTNSAGMWDDGNKASADKKMYDSCGGDFRILQRKVHNSEDVRFLQTILTKFECL